MLFKGFELWTSSCCHVLCLCSEVQYVVLQNVATMSIKRRVSDSHESVKHMHHFDFLLKSTGDHWVTEGQFYHLSGYYDDYVFFWISWHAFEILFNKLYASSVIGKVNKQRLIWTLELDVLLHIVQCIEERMLQIV